MSVWGALAGGAIGTAVLTSTLRFAAEVGWTRMDIPLLLGTVFTEDRRKAVVIGYALHFVNGLAFALLYFAVFEATGRADWLFGLALGAVHAVFVGGVLVNVLLPVVHPRMGTTWSDAAQTPLLEPPGFMLFNYGASTAVVTLVAHLAYGAIVGGFTAGL
jgi:hypothetical protein